MYTCICKDPEPTLSRTLMLFQGLVSGTLSKISGLTEDFFVWFSHSSARAGNRTGSAAQRAGGVAKRAKIRRSFDSWRTERSCPKKPSHPTWQIQSSLALQDLGMKHVHRMTAVWHLPIRCLGRTTQTLSKKDPSLQESLLILGAARGVKFCAGERGSSYGYMCIYTYLRPSNAIKFNTMLER